MTIYVSLPGQTKTPVIIPDNATFATFVKEAHKKTGCSAFSGLQVMGQGTVQTSPYESHVTKLNVFDVTTQAFVPLTNVSFSAAISTIFAHGDTILLLNVPIGG